MTKFFKFLPIISSTLIIPFAAISCAKDPNAQIPEPERVITQAEIEEGTIFFYESLFYSNYFQKLVIDHQLKNITKDLVINFALDHPQIQNLNTQTQNLIRNQLQLIKLNNDAKSPIISLEIKDLKYEHQLNSLKNEKAYTFKDNQIVDVDINYLNSFEDIFNVFNDIWNIKTKYNFLFEKPYTKIYDYEFSNTSVHNQNYEYLEKRSKINNLVANIYAWNFEYQINFTNKNNEFYNFEINKLKQAYENLLLLTNLYSDMNYYVGEGAGGWYDIKNKGIDYTYNKRPNFDAYPVIYFSEEENLNFPMNKQNSQDQIDKAEYFTWNPLYVSSFLPDNSYVFYEQIMTTIFENFYDFSKSSVFENRVSANFDSQAKIFEYDNTTKEVKLNNYSDFHNVPINLPIEHFDNKESRSYLEYMFAQWLFNSGEYVENFKDIALTPEEIANLKFIVQKEETIENQSYHNVFLKDFSSEKIIIKKQRALFFRNEQEFLNEINKKMLFQMEFETKYGYRPSWSAIGRQEISLKISSNEGLPVQASFIEDRPEDIKNIFTLKQQQQVIDNIDLVNEGAKIPDLIDLEINWKSLKSLVNQQEKKPYQIEETTIEKNTDYSDEIYGGQVKINLNLENTNLYVNNNNDNNPYLSQKIYLKYFIRFKKNWDGQKFEWILWEDDNPDISFGD